MSKPARKRDNQYYLERLRDEHAGIYADYQAGKFKNAAAAFLAAGLRNPQDALVVLKSAWRRADPTERDAFKLLIGCVAPTVIPPRTATLTTTTSPSVHLPAASHGRSGSTAIVIQSKRRLPPTLAAAVLQIMGRRQLKTGQIMREMGMNPRDASLGMALHRNTQVCDELASALEVWVRTDSRA